jgi:hypothetical protein
MKKSQLLSIVSVLHVLRQLFDLLRERDDFDSNQVLIQQMKRWPIRWFKTPRSPVLWRWLLITSEGFDWLYTAGLQWYSNKLHGCQPYLQDRQHTKTWQGTVLLQLVDEESLPWMTNFRNSIRNIQKQTASPLAMLCNMTVGLAIILTISFWQNTLISNPTKVWTPRDCWSWILGRHFYFSPGSGMHYSNTNTFILGACSLKRLTGTLCSRKLKTGF